MPGRRQAAGARPAARPKGASGTAAAGPLQTNGQGSLWGRTEGPPNGETGHGPCSHRPMDGRGSEHRRRPAATSPFLPGVRRCRRGHATPGLARAWWAARLPACRRSHSAVPDGDVGRLPSVRARRAGGWCVMTALMTKTRRMATGKTAEERAAEVEALAEQLNVAVAALTVREHAFVCSSCGRGSRARPVPRSWTR